MMKNLLWLLGVLGFAHSAAMAGSVSLGPEAKAILQTHCAGCHGGGTAIKGGFGFVLDRDLLIGRLLVTPGQAGQSDLFLRVQQGEMPPKSSKRRPSPAELKVLQRWIDAGAPPFDPAAKPAKILSPPQVMDAIQADLERLDPRRRRFTRYLTLSHLVYAGRPAKDVDVTRAAVGKLLNNLSWHPRLSLPEPVDADATILRIDLRAYKWNAPLWEKLATAYPYRLQTTADAKALKSHTETEVPAVRADWFVANAARPPFYHDLLQLPTSDRALERLLQVDVSGNVQEDSIMRAGFNDSGVSKNNRLLERHDSAYGAFWRSYDFAANTGRQNLFEHPLGPNTGAVSFQPAGGEMIFHLPNGLQAYMLVDAKGKRIDKGPIEIVADPRRPDQRVETGISCMSCHARGLLFKADQLRGHVEKNAQVFGKASVDAIRATHPRPAKFKAQIEEDNGRYLKAMEKFGVRDPEQEPVNLVTLRFEATLDAPTAAAELGLKVEELGPFLKGNAEQTRILGGLLVKGGTVQRATFQEHFPELARRILADQALSVAKNKPKRAPAFEGHSATVNAVAFSSDGQRAASGSDDRTIRIWEVPGGKLVASLEAGNSGEIYAVAFSSDGKYLLSAGRDRLVRLWDLEKRTPIRVFKGHTDSVRCVAFSPNGKWAVSGGDDRTLRIWDAASGAEKFTLDGHGGPITGVAWSSDGQRILSGSRDGTARWWDWKGQKQLAILEGHAGPVLSIALANDGKTALTGGNDKTVRLWNLASAKELHAFTGHANAVVHVQFHPNQREFLSSSSQHQGSENTWRRWDLADRKETGSLSAGTEYRFGCAAFSPDGCYILVGGPGGFLRLWSW
jgi:WD40 repeat protein/mono/diheme cytochrome c family protein